MKRAILAVVLTGAGLTSAIPFSGAAHAQRAGASTRMVSYSLRLRVDGSPAPGTTFWVAYGPLAGHFGLVRLHRQSPGMYVAQKLLPFGASADFAYIAGHGVIHTAHGAAPGNPSFTIRQVGPVKIGPNALPTLEWAAPVG